MRGLRRIELGCDPGAVAKARLDDIRIGGVGQIERHQRREIAAFRQGGQDTRAIVGRSGRRRHRRHQIGHDDGAGELPGGVADDRRQHGAVAQMDVPIVRAAKGKGMRRHGVSNFPDAAPSPSLPGSDRQCRKHRS
jgi:hypothetical protein